MPYTIETCYIPGGNESKFKSVLDNLNDVVTGAQADIDAALADPRLDAMLKTFKDGTKANDSVFTSPGITNVDGALADIGVLGFDSTPRDYQKVTEAKGFMFNDGDLYLVNQVGSDAVTQKAPASTYSVSGLGKGVTDVDLDYLNVIGTSGYDKNMVKQMGSYGQSAFKASASVSASSTGSEYQTDGNVSILREALRAAGGNIDRMAEIVDAGWRTGYAVVWSQAATIEHGIQLQDSGKYDVLREDFDYPVYDEQVGFYPERNIAIVATETFLGVNISRESALTLARSKYKQLHGTEISYTPYLTCRVFRFCLNNSLNGAPVVITSGLDVSKLGPRAYSLGISVGGYAIVVDVTGDRGSSTIGSYSVESVAACIHAQLGDILSVRSFGGELVLTSKVRGSSAFIQLFDTTYGAGDALGVGGAIAQMQRAAGEASSATQSLTAVKSVVVAGGSPDLANIDMAGNLISDAPRYGFTDEQILALVNGDYYWDALNSVSSRSKAAFDVVAASVSASSVLDRASVLDTTREAVSLLVQDTIFMDLPGLDIRMFGLFRKEFGDDGLIGILSQRPNIYDVSVTVPVAVGYAYLGQVLERIALTGGVETTTPTVDYITPFHTNASLAWKVLDKLEWLDLRTNDLDEAEFISELEELLGVGAGVTYSLSPTTAIGDGSTATKVGDTDLALRMQNPNWANSILSSIAAASVITIPQDWLNRQEATASRMLTNVENDITDYLDNKMSDLMSYLGLDDDLQFALRRYRDMIDGMKSIRKGLKMATDFCQRQQQVYANLMKIVNAGVNFNLNMYANFEVNTKFVQCYASGTSSAALGQAFSFMVNALNTAIEFLNKILSKISKALNAVFTAAQCAIQAVFSFFTASLSYSANATAAYSVLGVPMAVSMKMNCSITLGGYEPDPEFLSLLTQIQNQANALLSSLHLSTITFQKHKDTTDSLKAKVAGIGINDLIAQFEEKLLSLKSCF